MHERVRQLIQVEGEEWIWRGNFSTGGRARICLDGTLHYVHRLLFEQAQGRIDGLLVRTCTEARCVRPDHFKDTPVNTARARPRGADRNTRFWTKIDQTPSCWLWTGAKCPKGYGTFRVGRVVHKTHRLMWTTLCGPIPSCLHVLHRCDNPSCVRPEHLFLGTNQDNVDDCIQKGRKAVGSAMGMSKVTEADVVEIRRLRSIGTPRREVAAQFNIDRRTVTAITQRRAWRHVKD